MKMDFPRKVKRLKNVLACTTVVVSLFCVAHPIQAKGPIVGVSNEKELEKEIDSPNTGIIRLEKGSHIKLTKDHPAPKNTIGFDGQVNKDKQGNIIENTRPIIDGNKKHSIRLDDKNPDLDFIRNIGFRNGEKKILGEGSDSGGGAFYIPGNLENGIQNSLFESNGTDRNGGAIYVGEDFSGGIANSKFRGNQATLTGGAIHIGGTFNGGIRKSEFIGGSGTWGGAVYVEGNFKGNIIGSRFEGNSGVTGGGAVYVHGELVGGIIKSEFFHNSAGGQYGGGIYATHLGGGIVDSTFTANDAFWSGGAIFVDETLEGGITNSKFLGNNTTSRDGGAVAASDFDGNIENSHFTGNSAGDRGGALYVDAGLTGDIVASHFSENEAASDGGAIHVGNILEGDICEGSSFERNKSGGAGGAIFAATFEGGIYDSRFIGNEAELWGGALYVDDFLSGEISHSLFKGNQALAGGAVYVGDTLAGGIEDSKFSDNNAAEDGGAIYSFNLENGISSSDFDNNAAQGDGGALYVEGVLKGGIRNGSMFTDNMADGSGGAIYVSDFKGGIHDSYFADNVAGEKGGALYVDKLSGGIKASEFDNNSSERGGAIFAHILEGGIRGSIFTDNSARISGGAIHIVDRLKGDIRNNNFINNGAEDGGALYAGDRLEGAIVDNFFRDNYANYLGGAIFAKELAGGVNRSVFTDNSAMGWGGALYIGGILDGKIANSIFVRNHAGEISPKNKIGNLMENENPQELVGLGGAIFSYGEGSGNRVVTNSIFLGNSARSTVVGDSYGGLGGAIFHNATQKDSKSSILTIAATTHNRSIFYGNKSRRSSETKDRANAIYLGNMGKDDRTTNVNIRAESGSAIFMFDPLEAQGDGVVDKTGAHYGNLTVNIRKTGTGAWFLGGASVMHGAATWTIDEGSLHLTEVDGVEASVTLAQKQESRFNLGAGGIISGSGTVSARDINLSGTLDPSSLKKIGMNVDDITNETNIALGVKQSSIYGTLRLAAREGGSVVLKDATYVVDVGDHDNDLILVKGNLKIEGGVVDVRSHVSIKDEKTGTYKEDSHVLLKGEGEIAGQFIHVRDDLAFWNSKLDYVGDKVILRFVRDLGGATESCRGHNQCRIGEIIKGLGDHHKITGAIIDMKRDELGRAYDNLSGEIYASGRTALLGDNHLYRVVNQRMMHRSHNPDGLMKNEAQSALSPMWFSAFGHEGYYSRDPQMARLDTTGHGVTVGHDRVDVDGFLGGFFLGHETMRLTNGAARNSRSDVELYHIGAYLGGEWAGLRLSGGMIYNLLDIETERNIWVAGAKTSLAGKTQADYFGHKLQFFGEVAKDFDVGSTLTLTPYLQWSQNYLNISSAHESGSAAALDIAAATDSLFSTTIGLRNFHDLLTLTPMRFYADIGWHHNFGSGQAKSRHRFQGIINPFDIEGVGLGRDTIFVGAGVNATLSDTVSLGFGYRGQFGRIVANHSTDLQLKFEF